MGRQSSYSDTVAESICQKLADGQSLRAICSADDMPDRTTVDRWMAEQPDFAARCARAREEQAEFHHAEMDRIESGVLDGSINPQAANVVLSNKRWRMEKLKPKQYGQKVELEHSGSIQTVSEAELDARLSALLAKREGTET